MDDVERAWLREKLYEHAAELGAQREAQKAQAQDVSQLRLEIRDSIASLRVSVESHYQHVRGEIAALKDDARRRTDDLLEELKAEAAERERARKLALLVLGALVVFGQQAIEHLPQLLSLVGPG